MDNHLFSFDYDCSLEGFVDYYSNKTVETNTDISGLGVLIGFVGTAVLACLLLAFYYLVAHDPNQNPFACCGEPFGPHCHALGHSPSYWRANSIDSRVLTWIRKDRISTEWAHAREAISETILSLCDMQALTGYAILLSGFISLTNPTGPISMGDWHILAYTAWFSAVTHLSGLTVLRQPRYCQSFSKYVRLGSMALLLLLVCIALVPTGYLNNLNPEQFDVKENYTYPTKNGTNHTYVYMPTFSATLYRSPAVCYLDVRTANQLWQSGQNATASYSYGWWWPSIYPSQSPSLMSSIAMQSMLMAICTLVVGFLSRFVKLFSFLSHGITSGIRTPLSRGLRAMVLGMFPSDRVSHMMVHDKGKHFWRQVWTSLVVLPGFGGFLFLRWVAEIYTSMIFEVIWIAIVIIWGYVKLAALRSMTAPMTDAGASTSQGPWTFGQIIAVALLASPVIMVAGKFISWKWSLIKTDQSPEPLRHPCANYRRNSIGLDSLQGEAPDNLPILNQQIGFVVGGGLENRSFPSKRQLVHAIIDVDAGCIPHWLDICNAAACLLWLGILLLAVLFTNHTLNRGVVSSLSKFWFGSVDGSSLSGGALWVMTITHPMAYAMCVAAFVEFDSRPSEARSSDASPMTLKRKILYGSACTIVQAASGTTTIFFKPPTLNPVAYHIAIAVSYYTVYSIVVSAKHSIQWLRKAMI